MTSGGTGAGASGGGGGASKRGGRASGRGASGAPAAASGGAAAASGAGASGASAVGGPSARAGAASVVSSALRRCRCTRRAKRPKPRPTSAPSCRLDITNDVVLHVVGHGPNGTQATIEVEVRNDLCLARFCEADYAQKDLSALNTSGFAEDNPCATNVDRSMQTRQISP